MKFVKDEKLSGDQYAAIFREEQNKNWVPKKFYKGKGWCTHFHPPAHIVLATNFVILCRKVFQEKKRRTENSTQQVRIRGIVAIQRRRRNERSEESTSISGVSV